MHAGKAGQASMAREVKMGETARVRSFFFLIHRGVMFGSMEGEKGKPLQFEAAPVYEQSPWCLKVHVDLLI
jgi:hypothetical protein